jgi:tape measure domain-containing protein
MAVETAVVAKLSADDREFIAGMFRAQQAANNFSTSVTASQTKMAALAGAVGGVASTVGMSFIQMSKSAASFAFNTVADFEQTRIGFEGIMGSAESAKAMLDELQAFAATTPFEFTELATSTKQLLAIGYAAEDVIPMMTKLGDATANLGLSQEAMKATIRALGQIKGMGRPLTQDLYQISNALPGFNPFDAIAKGVGKSQAETRKMIEQGLIPADQAIEAILKGMQEMPGAAGAMGRQVNTIRGQLSNLADTIKINLIKGFGDTGIAVSGLKGVVAAVGPFMATSFKMVGAVLQAVAPLFSTLGAVIGAAGAVIKPFAAVLGGVFLGAMKGLEIALKAITAPIQALAGFIRNNATAFQILTGAILLLTIAWNASTIATKLNAIAVKVWAATTAAATAIMKAFQGGLVAIQLLMAANPAVVWIAAIAALIAIFVLAWQNSETFRDVVTQAFDTVARVVGGAIGWVLQTLGKMVMVLGMVLDENSTFGKIIRTVYTAIYKTIAFVIKAVLNYFAFYLGVIADIMDTNGTLGKIIAMVFNFIGKTIFTVLGGVIKFFGMFISAIGDILDTNSVLGNIIAEVFNFIFSTIGKVVGGVLGFFGKWLTNIADFLLGNKDAVNALVKIFTALPNAIGNVVKFVLGGFQQILKGIGVLAAEGADKIAKLAEAFADLISKVPGMGGLASALRSGASAVRGIGVNIQNAMGSASGAIQNVINGVSNFQAKLVDPNTYTGAIKSIKGIGQTLTKVSETAFKVSEIKMGDVLMDTISSGLKKVGGFVEGIGNKILTWADIDLGDALVDAVGKAAAGARDMVKKVLDVVNQIDVDKAVDTVFDTASKVAMNVGQKIADMGTAVAAYTASGFTNKVTNAIQDTIAAIKDRLGLSDAADVIAKSNKEYEDAIKDAPLDDKGILKQAETMEKIRAAMKKGVEAIQGVLDDLQKAAADFAKSLKESITGFAGLAGIELPDGFIPQAKSLIKNMEMRLKKSQDFAVQIGQLQSYGLNADSLKTILDEGPIKGAQLAASILSGGLAAVQEINRLEGQIAVVGASIGAIGKEAVFGGDIKTAQDYLAKYTPDGTTANQYGNNVVIADGAFKTVINISGAQSPEEQIQLIQDGIESKFAELARALAAKTGA